MISVVICSRKKELDSGLSENIKSTIGCPYELVVIDNSANDHTIFEAYNQGIAQSAGEVCCFIHDDIFIHTTGWGTIVNRIFDEHPKAGLLGVAGSKIKTAMPSGWWNCPETLKEINILQHLDDGKKEKWEFGFKTGNLSEVAAVDGVFMALRKSTGCRFNTDLKGFHNYDLNLSIECRKKGFSALATNEILIEHFSNGNLNDSWLRSTLELHRIYRKSLPVTVKGFDDPALLKAVEIDNAKRMAGQLLRAGYRSDAAKIWRQLFMMQPFSGFHFRFLKKLIRSLSKRS